MQLSIIQLDPRYYSILDMYTLEQFYIEHLNSKFNAVKVVHFARKRSNKDLFTNKTSLITDPLLQLVYIYDKTKTKLLYIAKSANNATLVLETGSDSIRNSILEKKLFLNYFFLSLNKIQELTAEDNLLSLHPYAEELIKLKISIKTKYTPTAIAERKKSVILTNVNNPKLSKTVDSISEAERYLNEIKGIKFCTRAGLRYSIKKNILFVRRVDEWLIKLNN